MNIFILTRADVKNGSTRVRALQFVKYWRDSGHKIKVLQRESRTGLHFRGWFLVRLIARSIWADVVYLQKPNLSIFILKIIRFWQPNMVTDFDDAVWEQPVTKKDTNSATVNAEFGRRLKEAIKLSKTTIAGSNYLAAWAHDQVRGAKIFVVPPSVEIEKYQGRKHKVTKDKPVVVWIGSNGNLVDLEQVCEILHALFNEGKLKFLIVSDVQPVGYQWAEFVEWSEETEAEVLQNADIGIMPLIDEPRSRGRCGYKAIQYMAAGLPVICSPVGGGKEVVEHNVNGLWATDSVEWISALKMLLENSTQKSELGLKAEQTAIEFYDVKKAADSILEIFKRIS